MSDRTLLDSYSSPHLLPRAVQTGLFVAQDGINCSHHVVGQVRDDLEGRKGFLDQINNPLRLGGGL